MPPPSRAHPCTPSRADKEAAAAALAKNQAAQWAAQAALRSTEAKVAHLAAIEARRTTLARMQRAAGVNCGSAGKWVEGRRGCITRWSRLGARRLG
ncbi:hypothetical protein FIBSPDRAFT_849102, partial [Athelia psychrophila]